MAKLVYVGENPNNKGGSSSKAWCIRRKGTSVVIKHGAIEIVGGMGGKYYWIGKFPKVEPPYGCYTIRKAINSIKKKIEEKKDEGYGELPRQVRIRASRKKIVM